MLFLNPTKFNTMKKLLLICLGLGLISCSDETKIDYAILSGKIVNPVNKEITVFDDNDKVKTITISSEGTFVDTLKIETGYYSLGHGRSRVILFLNPGDDIKLSLNTEALNETAEFSGIGSEDNAFLAAKYISEAQYNLNYEKLYAMDESEFLAIMNEVKSSKIEFLKAASSISEALRQSEEKTIENEFLKDLQNYIAKHAQFANENGYQPSKELLNLVESLK